MTFFSVKLNSEEFNTIVIIQSERERMNIEKEIRVEMVEVAEIKQIQNQRDLIESREDSRQSFESTVIFVFKLLFWRCQFFALFELTLQGTQKI